MNGETLLTLVVEYGDTPRSAAFYADRARELDQLLTANVDGRLLRHALGRLENAGLVRVWSSGTKKTPATYFPSDRGREVHDLVLNARAGGFVPYSQIGDVSTFEAQALARTV
jgi:hypothetical protein